MPGVSRQSSTPPPFFAITIDSVPDDRENETTNIDILAESIRVLVDKAREKGVSLVTRIVVDPVDADAGLPYPSDDAYKQNAAGQIAIYKKAAERIRRVGSSVMLELADSHDMYVLQREGALRQKANVYMNELRENVDLWEVGNEVNGEWTGLCDEETKDVITPLKNKCNQTKNAVKEMTRRGVDAQRSQQAFIAKQVIDAHRLLSDAGKKTVLTLYHNNDPNRGHCLDIGGYDEDAWVSNNLAGKPIMHELSYVLLSFYEDDCGGIRTVRLEKDPRGNVKNRAELNADINNWEIVFTNLEANFRPASVGFGEMAPRCNGMCKDRKCEKCVVQQEEFIQRYYGVYHPELTTRMPKYIGGYFYWYFYQDVYKRRDKQALEYLKKYM
jgi:hypothetical protein